MKIIFLLGVCDCYISMSFFMSLSAIKWAIARENLSSVFANNKDTDQPAHPCRLISAFVFRFLEGIICKLNTGEISIVLLVSVAEEKGFKLALTEAPKTGFLATRPKIL